MQAFLSSLYTSDVCLFPIPTNNTQYTYFFLENENFRIHAHMVVMIRYMINSTSSVNYKLYQSMHFFSKCTSRKMQTRKFQLVIKTRARDMRERVKH